MWLYDKTKVRYISITYYFSILFFFFLLIGKQRYIKALAKQHKKVHMEYTN